MNKDNLDALDKDFEDEYDVSWEDEVYNDWRISLCIIVYNNNRHQELFVHQRKKRPCRKTTWSFSFGSLFTATYYYINITTNERKEIFNLISYILFQMI